MRRMTPRLATAALLASLALTASTGNRADAASVQTYAYSTTGDIAGMTGDTPIIFAGQSGTSTLTTPGALLLGTFETNPLPASGTLTYNNTPFTIDLRVVDYQPATGAPYPAAYAFDTDYKISGVLNGSITGAGMSSMFALVTSIVDAGDSGYMGEPPFPVSALQILAPQGIAAPNGEIAGISLLAGVVTVSGLPSPAPEPTSIAAFLAALAGYAMRKRLRARA